MRRETVRCYQCRTRIDPAAESCPLCDAPQRWLCACGATHSVSVPRCPRCHLAGPPTETISRGSRRRRSRRRLLVLAVCLMLLGAGGFFLRSFILDRAKRRMEVARIAAREIDRGNYDAARVRLRASLIKDGDNPRVLYLLAVAEHALGHSKKAEQAARKALFADPGNENAGLLLDEILLSTHRAPEALRRARAALAHGSRSGALHEMVARALLATGSGAPGEIERELRAATALAPSSRSAAIELGRWLLVQAEAFPNAPIDPASRRAMRKARVLIGRELGAKADLETYRLAARFDLVFKVVNHLDALMEPVERGRADPPYRLLLARLAFQSGRVNEANRLRKGLCGKARRASTLLGLRDLCREMGDRNGAKEALDAAKKRFPDDPAVVLTAARAELAAGDLPGAEQKIRAALDRKPDPQLAVFLAGLLASRKRSADAEAVLRAAIRADPKQSRVRLSLAGLLLDRKGPGIAKRRAEAAKLVDAARTTALQKPAEAVLLRRIDGRIAIARGHMREAVKALTSVTRWVPSDAGAHVLLARAYRALGQTPLVLEELNAAIGIRGPEPPLLLGRAEALLRARRFDAAARDCRAALEKKPDDKAGLLLLAQSEAGGGKPLSALHILDELPVSSVLTMTIRGRALLAAGHKEEARAQAEKATRAKGSVADRFSAELLLARVRDAIAGPEVRSNRRQFLETYLRDHPANAAAHRVLAKLLLDGGEIGKARTALATALAACPDDVDLLWLRAEACLTAMGKTRRDVDGASAAAGKLHRIAPGSGRDLYLRGRLALVRKSPKEALGLLSRAARLEPQTPTVLAFLGLAQHRLGQDHAAAGTLSRALDLDPHFRFPKRLLGEVMLGEARARLTADDPGGALDLLVDAARYSPRRPGVVAGLRRAARGAMRAGDKRLLLRAREECRNLLEGLGPTAHAARARILRAIGNMDAELGDYAALLATAREQVALMPHAPRALARLALALALDGKTGDALEAVTRARKRLGDVPVLLAARWRILGGAGRKKEAEEAARTWAAAAPKSAFAELAWARTLERLGKKDAAVAPLRKAIALDPNLFGAANRLVGLLVSKGKVDEASSVLTSLEKRASARVRPAIRWLRAETLLRSATGGPEAKRILGDLAESSETPLGVRLSVVRRLVELRVSDHRMQDACAEGSRLLGWVGSEPRCGPGTPLARLAGETLSTAGTAATKAGSTALAKRLYREALERLPDDVTALCGLSGLLAVNGVRAGQAVELAKRAVRVAPRVPEAHAALGAALLVSGDARGAVAAYGEAVTGFRDRIRGDGEKGAGGPDARKLALALVGEARAQAAMAKKPEAKAALKAAVAADPSVTSTPEYKAAEMQAR